MDNPFIVHISALRRILIKRKLQRALLATLMAFTLLQAIFFTVIKLGWVETSIASAFMTALGTSILFSVLQTLTNQTNLMDELITIEKRVDLKSRLSTAYECQRNTRNSIFIDALIQDVNHMLDNLSYKEMFPTLFSRAHLLIPFFLLISLGVFVTDWIPNRIGADRPDDKALEQIALKIKEYNKRVSPVTDNKEKGMRNEMSRAMGEMERKLDEKKMTQKELIRSIDSLRRTVQAELADIANRVRAQLNPGDISNTPMLTPLKEMKFERDSIRKMTELLNQLFKGDMPASIVRDLTALEQTYEMDRFLDQIRNELSAGVISESEPSSRKRTKDAVLYSGEEKKNRPEKPSDKDDPPPEGLNHMELSGPVTSLQTPGDGLSENDTPVDPDLVDQISQIPGKAKAKGKENEPYEIKTARGPKFREKGLSLKGDRYNAHVRSLTTIGQPKMEQTDVYRSYYREIENMLQREDIPLNYRQFIKNYFLSIGLGKEEERDGDGT